MSLILTFLVITAASPAPAASPTPVASPAPSEASKLFETGRQALKSQRYQEASDAFQQSYSLEPALGTLLNWSNCLDKLGKAASAWVLLNDAVTWAQRTHEAEREVYARQLAKALKPRVSWLALSADTEVDATLDGVSLHITSTPFSVPVDRGSRVLRVNQPGFQPFETTVDIAAEGVTVSLKLPPLKPETPPPAPPPVIETSPWPAPMPSVGVSPPMLVTVPVAPSQSTAGAAFIVSGGVVALAGAVGLAWSLSTYEQLQNQRVGLPVSELVVSRDDYERIKWVYPAAWSAVGVGLAAAAAGTYFLVKERPVSVVPTVQPGGAGVSVSGQF